MTRKAARGRRDEQAVADYVERFGDVLTDAGMPRLASRVFARLLADDDGRMTAAELTEALAVSPAAISGAVNYLTHVRMIGKERERGSRRDVYVVHADAWHEAVLNRDRVMSAIQRSMSQGVAAVGGAETPAGRRMQLSVDFVEFLTDRLQDLQGEWAERRAKIIAAWPPDA
ncbi:MAG: transcriptional regulator TrmB [Intrasporangium sp.]|uniref:GbsR/MarR family transcriptional regulator n=1 Tax=Intrasporangium sp. TaxID=1925024 RepID=UPI00264737A4|nr:MarR family transcriptional regulator [Intrasporangium sp.]MDN5796264.1 transcriptional regulator TrmB [Intrasporangium sp.]